MPEQSTEPTPEEKDRAKKSKYSIRNILQRLDIYSKFKVVAEIQGRTLMSALKEAISDYIKKYSGEKE